MTCLTSTPPSLVLEWNTLGEHFLQPLRLSLFLLLLKSSVGRSASTHFRVELGSRCVPTKLFFLSRQILFQEKQAKESKQQRQAGSGTAPAVVKGGPGRGEGQPLAQVIPLPGHLLQLEQHRLHVLPREDAVDLRVAGRRRGGWGGRTCGCQHVTGARRVCVCVGGGGGGCWGGVQPPRYSLKASIAWRRLVVLGSRRM